MDPFPVIRGLAYLTVAGQVLAVLLFVGVIVQKVRPLKVLDFLGQKSLFLALIIVCVATGGSLFLSEVALFEPCKLCWFQRIAMYPQVVLFAVALFSGLHPIVWRSSIILCVLGSGTAIFHYMLQMSDDPSITDLAPCSLYGGSCTEYYILQFGYITIPLMALTAFVLILLLLILGRRHALSHNSSPISL
jgi:disulfide bond formation protein DsbB